ncbi:SpoIIE family protein phosphatase [Streptomyces sp. NBC_00882]|uniref:SpoIIE family protein phosphatase n=1 Tax=Streptomyces TaxID=1883 RepID=UPI00386E5220|nr:SpoIIE family protein phosphatase [Streptomyces sp. NBC_00882]WSZ62594.1 SpoIIE family protein phosphatase [Streptomyces canus]
MDTSRALGLVVTDHDGLITGWSRGAEQLLGHTAAEAAGQPVAELLGLEDAAGPEERHMALPVRDRDGSLLTLPVSSYPLADDMAGCETRPGSILVVGPPPTGDALQERDALSTWTLEASPLALTVYDTDLRCVWQSDRMRRLSGLSDEERRGHRLTDVLPTPDSARWEERVRRALLTGEEQTDEIRSSNPAASPTRVFGVSATPLRDERGQTLGVCTTVTDVTRASRDRERLALLNDASVRVGSTLDVTQTGRELTEVVVPRFADFARVDLLEVLLRGDEPAPGPIAGAVRLRRIAELNLFEGVLEAQTTAGDSDVYLVNSPAALCLASGRSAMYRTEDPVIRAWAALSPARQAKIARFGTHSWMLLPVRARGTTLGVVMLTRTRETPEPFEPGDLPLAEDLVARAAVCLDNARRFTRERTAALALQRSLLPRRLPHQSAVQVASRYLPASPSIGVGGDWYDVIRLSGERVALVVGDVVGHGIHAAAAMGRLRTAVRTLADVDPTPDELLTRLDDLVIQLSAESDGDRDDDLATNIGATCLYAVYDPVSRRCSLARAGHPAPVLVAPDGAAGFLEVPAGPPLGLGGVPFESVEVTLSPGSLLALYTDGLVESRQRDLDAGLEVLRTALTVPADSLEDVCEHVVRTALPNSPVDDAALLLVRTRALDGRRVAAWDIAADAAAVSRVRSESVRRMVSWGLQEAAFVTELVVSELVTNAIRYGAPPIQLRLIHDHVLTCEVSDASSTAPHMRRARVFDEGGRGLLLVAQLTQRWGTRQTSTGKTIWCEQALPTEVGAVGPEAAEAA